MSLIHVFSEEQNKWICETLINYQILEMNRLTLIYLSDINMKKQHKLLWETKMSHV